MQETIADESEWVLPFVDPARCTACGRCEQLCPTQAIEVRGNIAVVVRPRDCSFCEVCESYCPEGAIGRPFTITFARLDNKGRTPPTDHCGDAHPCRDEP
jgi:formate hydrogenlyase subunit 6/NADH:ubiquinone oxidoreductase subunit I